jgi:hypothetical protein
MSEESIQVQRGLHGAGRGSLDDQHAEGAAAVGQPNFEQTSQHRVFPYIFKMSQEDLLDQPEPLQLQPQPQPHRDGWQGSRSKAVDSRRLMRKFRSDASTIGRVALMQKHRREKEKINYRKVQRLLFRPDGCSSPRGAPSTTQLLRFWTFRGSRRRWRSLGKVLSALSRFASRPTQISSKSSEQGLSTPIFLRSLAISL